MARSFADLVNEAMAQRRTPEGRPWSDYTLSAAIGLLPGDKSFNAKQVWRLRRGERKGLTADLVGRIIEVLELDPNEAWPAAGLSPPDLTPDHLRQLDLFRRGTARDRRSDREVPTDTAPAGAAVRAEGVEPRNSTAALEAPARAAA